MAVLDFLSDEHIMICVAKLYETYDKCQQKMSLDKFYSNKVDPIKFHFDMSFNEISPENYFDLEIIRQNDKTISNAIGYFHQSLLGGLPGFEDLETGNGCDLKNSNNTIFAEIKNKHNTMNSSSSESTFQKLASFSDRFPNSTCYLIEIIAKRSQDIPWEGSFNGTYYSHPNVRRISADKFYALATGKDNAFKELCDALPLFTEAYVKHIASSKSSNETQNNLYDTISTNASTNKLDILSQIMKDNFFDYNGF